MGNTGIKLLLVCIIFYLLLVCIVLYGLSNRLDILANILIREKLHTVTVSDEPTTRTDGVMLKRFDIWDLIEENKVELYHSTHTWRRDYDYRFNLSQK